MGYEVVWSELLVQFLSTRAYAFAVMLATYLAGLALGSYLFARGDGRRADPWRVFGLLLAGAGATAIAIVALLGVWITDAQTFAGMWAMRATGAKRSKCRPVSSWPRLRSCSCLRRFWARRFPRHRGSRRMPRARAGRWASPSRSTSLAASWERCSRASCWCHRLGLVRALGLLAVAGAIMGAVAFRKGGGSFAMTGAIVAAILAVVVFTPPDKMARLLVDKRGGQLRFYEEGAGGTVAVIEQLAPAGAFRRLYIQGVSNSGDTLASLRYMRLQALLPLLIHDTEPRAALVVGLVRHHRGRAAADSSLERRVVAELLPAVVRAVPLFAGNLGVAADLRVEIRVGDGGTNCCAETSGTI